MHSSDLGLDPVRGMEDYECVPQNTGAEHVQVRSRGMRLRMWRQQGVRMLGLE